MASGSGSHSQEGEESRWLDLGLALGPNHPSTTAPSTTITAAQYGSSLLPSLPWGHHQSLLGLGFGDDGGVRRPVGAMHYCEGWHYHSVANLPSSSSSIFPTASLLLSSGRVRPEVGLWFSLVALPCWYSNDHCLFVFCLFQVGGFEHVLLSASNLWEFGFYSGEDRAELSLRYPRRT